MEGSKAVPVIQCVVCDGFMRAVVCRGTDCLAVDVIGNLKRRPLAADRIKIPAGAGQCCHIVPALHDSADKTVKIEIQQGLAGKYIIILVNINFHSVQIRVAGLSAVKPESGDPAGTVAHAHPRFIISVGIFFYGGETIGFVNDFAVARRFAGRPQFEKTVFQLDSLHRKGAGPEVGIQTVSIKDQFPTGFFRIESIFHPDIHRDHFPYLVGHGITADPVIQQNLRGFTSKRFQNRINPEHGIIDIGEKCAFAGIIPNRTVHQCFQCEFVFPQRRGAEHHIHGNPFRGIPERTCIFSVVKDVDLQVAACAGEEFQHTGFSGFRIGEPERKSCVVFAETDQPERHPERFPGCDLGHRVFTARRLECQFPGCRIDALP